MSARTPEDVLAVAFLDVWRLPLADRPAAILAALSAAGLVVVPMEPTEAMLDAAFADAVAWLERADIGNTNCKSDRERSAEPNRSIYRAMIAAASPAAPQEDRT